MLSYGDVVRTEPVDRVRRSIAGGLEAVIGARPGHERHELLVRAFVETGELVQGLADQEFEAAGADDVSERQTAGACLLLAEARAILQSWEDGFGGAVTAALFLEKFVKDVPWAHLDIYAWKDSAEGPWLESGGSGQTIPCLSEWLQNLKG